MNMKFIILGVATALGGGLFYFQGTGHSIDEEASTTDVLVTYKR